MNEKCYSNGMRCATRTKISVTRLEATSKHSPRKIMSKKDHQNKAKGQTSGQILLCPSKLCSEAAWVTNVSCRNCQPLWQLRCCSQRARCNKLLTMSHQRGQTAEDYVFNTNTSKNVNGSRPGVPTAVLGST